MNSISRRIAFPVLGAMASQFLMDKKSPHTTKAETANANNNNGNNNKNSRPKLLLIGTGSSTGCPKPLCSMLFGAIAHKDKTNISKTSELARLQQEYKHRCRTSAVATRGDPKQNKNYRNNPALVISHCCEQSKSDTSCTECKNIIIDTGKTFREAAIRWFPERSITGLDAIILTHHHMDAAGGLDDVRGFQKVAQIGTFHKAPTMIPMPLFLSEFCLNDVSQRFPWLFPQQQPDYKTGSEITNGIPAIDRHVASFDVQIFDSYVPMYVQGLEIIPLPVWHGDDLISYGFAFSLYPNQNNDNSNTKNNSDNSTSSNNNINNNSHKTTTTNKTKGNTKKSNKPIHVVYISDISRMIPETMYYIMNKLPPTDILIVDALLPDRPHSVHYSLDQAIELSKQMKAKQTYVVGMNCDAFPLHDEMNEKLQQQHGGQIQLAYDGQVIYA